MVRYFVYLFILCLSVSAYGQTGKKQPILSVNPADFLIQGAQLGLDIPLTERSSVKITRTGVFTYRPEFLTNRNFFFSTFGDPFLTAPSFTSELQAVSKQGLSVALKYPVFKKSGLFNGYYWGPEFNHSVFNSIAWDQIGNGSVQGHNSNRSVFVRTGLCLGWQRQFGVHGFADLSLSFLFNTFTNVTDPIFVWDGGTLLNSELPFFAEAKVSLGAMLPSGRQLDSVSSFRSNKIAMSLDLAGLLRMGLEADVHIPLKGHRTIGLKGAVYNLPENLTAIYDIPMLEFFQGYRLGLGLRQYMPERPVFSGPFIELAAAYRELDVTFREGFPRKEQIFSSYSGTVSIGLSKTYLDFFLAEVFMSNRLVFANDRLRKRYPGADFSSGLTTELGLRFGVVL